MYNRDSYDWFRRQEPIDKLGYSIHIYDVAEKANGDWVAHCMDPTPAIEDHNYVSKLVNQPNPRHVYFDCRPSWVFPSGGDPGWYILPPSEEWPLDHNFPDHFQLVYAQEATELAPAFEVYYWNGQTKLKEWMASSNKQAEAANGEPVKLPLLLGELIQLEGYLVDGSQWLTIWRVQASTDIPLSMAGHLYTESPAPTIMDGLGFTSVQWRADDVFLQTYDVELTVPSLYIETGLYNYLTGERLTFSADSQNGDFIQLPAIE